MLDTEWELQPGAKKLDLMLQEYRICNNVFIFVTKWSEHYLLLLQLLL